MAASSIGRSSAPATIPDANYLQSAVGLVWRTLVTWMIVLLLITIAYLLRV
jgi:membrane protein required for beta-lactamase induction